MRVWHPACVFLLYVLFFYTSTKASFWDGLIGISQLKSTTQTLSGDIAGAKHTKRNFMNQMPIVSQVKQIMHYKRKEDLAAIQTSKQFLFETVEPIFNHAPILGHIKGMMHIMLGEKDRGLDTLRGATTATGE